ncbi:MAG: threonine-phosphate decarboxylase CobD [Actinobacteria bacterium]|nr:threonine-phosphate decarboxylase CobD [Actinomycetota bacterium]
MDNFTHGGNLREIVDKYNINESKIVDFSSNINPLGIPDSIKKLIAASIDKIYHYPDPEYRLLKEKLSISLGIDARNLLPGNGSNELIYLLVNTLAPKRVLIPVPTYCEYERAAAAIDSECVFLSFCGDDGFDFDVDKIVDLAGGVDVIFICNPNNPTGWLWQREEIEYLIKECEKKNVFLIIDEAFMDFVVEGDKATLVRSAANGNNFAVLRSLTKIFAIPGLRLGYLAGNKELVKKLSERQSTWSVNNIAQLVGSKLLENYDFIIKSKEYIFREREVFFGELENIIWLEPFKPSANFIFCKIKDHKITSGKLSNYLAKNFRILIRDCSNFRGLDNSFIRLAVKTREENKRLLNCLNKYYKTLNKGK